MIYNLHLTLYPYLFRHPSSSWNGKNCFNVNFLRSIKGYFSFHCEIFVLIYYACNPTTHFLSQSSLQATITFRDLFFFSFGSKSPLTAFFLQYVNMKCYFIIRTKTYLWHLESPCEVFFGLGNGQNSYIHIAAAQPGKTSRKYVSVSFKCWTNKKYINFKVFLTLKLA